MADVSKTSMLQDWTEHKSVMQLQQLFKRLVAKFDYAHPESEQNKRQLQRKTPVSKEAESRRETIWQVKPQEKVTIREEETVQQLPDKESVEKATSEVDTSEPSSKEDKSTLTYLAEQGAQILAALGFSSAEEQEPLAEKRVLPTMDVERESIVEAELKWEKEHGMQTEQGNQEDF
jgi:hypothetical protein